MAKPNCIEFPDGTRIPILYEDRSVLALDKPRHWKLVPFNWQGTDRNLHAALVSSIEAGDYWAVSRHVRFIRHVHRLDADTTGVLLCVKNRGAVEPFSELFASRAIRKTYLAVVHGRPQQTSWTCTLAIAPDPAQIGRVKTDARRGKEAETFFKVVESRGNRTLVEAHPHTGRTHQIRVHLAAAGLPIVGDPLYGQPGDKTQNMALRAIAVAYRDPFTRRDVWIEAARDWFLREYQMSPRPEVATRGTPVPRHK
jgi:23S rRNA pseudouridine1911/1915/1917 synthase